MKINQSTEFNIDLKTIIGIVMFTSSMVGMYYTLQSDIDDAKKMPKAAIDRSYANFPIPITHSGFRSSTVRLVAPSQSRNNRALSSALNLSGVIFFPFLSKKARGQ